MASSSTGTIYIYHGETLHMLVMFINFVLVMHDVMESKLWRAKSNNFSTQNICQSWFNFPQFGLTNKLGCWPEVEEEFGFYIRTYACEDHCCVVANDLGFQDPAPIWEVNSNNIIKGLFYKWSHQLVKEYLKTLTLVFGSFNLSLWQLIETWSLRF